MRKNLRAMAMAAPVTAAAPEVTAVHTTRPAKRRPSGARRGRPLKFGRPARAVTLTLPVDVLEALRAIHRDIGRAVVRAMEHLVVEPVRSAGLVSFGDQAAIMVPPTRNLRERVGIDLVPLAEDRSLLSFDESLPIADIELRIGEALADPAVGVEDRAVFEAAAETLRTARRDGQTMLPGRSIVVLQRAGESRSVTMASASDGTRAGQPA